MAMLALAGCSRQEAADWKQATLADSSEAYQLFLQQHPHSAEATQAQARMQQLAEQRDWQIASAADTRDSYQLFLTQHADSKWAQEARIRIENFAQAGVSGGPALTAAAASPSATGAAEAGANDASAAQSGTAAGAPVAPAAAATSATSAASTVAAASAPAARAHAQHTTQRAHARLAHTARPASHRVARVAHNSQPSRLLQLGAFHSRASAESEWRALSARFSTLKGLHPRYVAAHSRSGRVYRLQVRVSSAAEASGVCASLRHHARPCVRVTA